MSDGCSGYRIPGSIEVLDKPPNGRNLTVQISKSNQIVKNTQLYICLKYNNSWVPQNDNVIFLVKPIQNHLPMWASIVILVALLLISGLYSGLNLGLMALTPRELELIKISGTQKEKEYAEKILPIRKKGNVLLCSILFGITIFNATSTVIVEDLTTSMMAIIISTILIVTFCELLPQSICSQYGLFISANTTFMTEILCVVTWPVSFPLGKILNLILGDQTPCSYNRNQLLEVFRLNKEGGLQNDEVCIFNFFNLK
ncbi:Metal transporter CNNM4 [Thelohanellus kitauei]|uniref:Metal transporter CNNM4 n=1 Tax=Thelohanellus kitauei TaxID=669202 RepID=A0A0C2JS39_THEKT|nr:Metal transporter CNNM4 [Thelohanellus kitauei]